MVFQHDLSLLPCRYPILDRIKIERLSSSIDFIMQTWTKWQAEVVATLKAELGEVLDAVTLEDVDWVAWYGLYLDGRSPQAAVNRALERDL